MFLVIEGGAVDWASHDNSIVGVISEMEDFMAATQVVLDYARENPDTLVIITADHPGSAPVTLNTPFFCRK